METRANHVLIGSFTLLIIVGALGFALWLAKIEIDRRFSYYDIFFEGSVAGLSEAGDVRYQGVRVGQVKEIQIDPQNPGQVRVRIEVDANTPVTEGASASLEFFGVTGVLYVQISAGDPNAPPITPPQGKQVATLPAQKSSIEELFAGAPQLLDNAVILVDRLSRLVNSDNRQTITDILNNVAAVSGAVAGRSDEIDALLGNAHKISDDMAAISANLNRMSGRLDNLDGELQAFLSEANRSAQAIGGLASELDLILKDNKMSINSFTGSGLREFTLFVTEARQLVVTLERLAQRVESDPARFFLGTSASEYRPE